MKKSFFLFPMLTLVLSLPLLGQRPTDYEGLKNSLRFHFNSKANQQIFAQEDLLRASDEAALNKAGFNLRAVCEDIFEPNDSLPTIIEGPVFQNSELCLTPGDQDWFRFIFHDREYIILVNNQNENEEGKYGLLVQMNDTTISIETFSVNESDLNIFIGLLVRMGQSFFVLGVGDNSDGGQFPQIEYPVGLGLPDLLSPTRDLNINGLQLSGKINIVNIGYETMQAPSTVYLSLGSEDNLSSSQVRIKSYEIPILDALESIEIEYFVNLLTDCEEGLCVEPGNYRLYIEIDPDRLGGEVNYGNNVTWFPNIPIIVPEDFGEECIDEYEPNDTNLDAFLIPDESFRNEELCLTEDDADWFSFMLDGSMFYLEAQDEENLSLGRYRFSFRMLSNQLFVECLPLESEESINIILYNSELEELASASNELTYAFQFKDSLNLSTIYVDRNASGNNDGGSWENAFDNLHSALAIADSGDQVWIARGTYYPVECNPCIGIDRSISFQVPAYVDLIGGFSGNESSIGERKTDSLSLFQVNATRISGNIGNKTEFTDNSFSLVQGGELCSFNGFILEEGYMDREWEWPGIGIIRDISNFALCSFSNNHFSTGNENALLFYSIYEYGGEFDQCYFSNNHGGTIIDLSFSSAVLTNSHFSSNQSLIIRTVGDTPYGFSAVKIDSCSFFQNKSIMGSYGFTNFDITNSTFTGTDSIAFSLQETYNLEPYAIFTPARFANCFFANNEGTSIYYKGKQTLLEASFPEERDIVTVENCCFKSNKSGVRPLIVEEAILEAQDCKFIDNSGGIQGFNSSLFIKDCLFEGDSSIYDNYYYFLTYQFGAGLYTENCETEVINSVFQDNTVVGDSYILDEALLIDGGGGAIYNKGGKHIISDCIFENNSEYGKGGGAILCENADIILKRSKFFGNRCLEDDLMGLLGTSGLNGGGLFTINSNIEIDSCIFEGNQATIGGAICLLNDSDNPFDLNNISNSYFEENQVKSNHFSDFLGGGIFVSGNTQISNSLFHGNDSSTRGGGIYSSGNLSIQNSTISQNHSQKGGGIYFLGQLSINSTTISGNKSCRGGGIFSDSNQLTFADIPFDGDDVLFISHSTLYQNLSDSSGNSIYISHDDSLYLRNSLIAGEGAQIRAPQGANAISLGYNLVSNPTSLIYQETDILGTNNNPINPLLDTLKLNGGPTPTHALMVGSPAIGAGEPISRLANLTDQRGYSRSIGSTNSRIDIGAFEYQESLILSPETQICQNERQSKVVETISLIDSTGGGWEIGDKQELYLGLPEGMKILQRPEGEVFGEGLELVNIELVDQNTVKVVYNRYYTTVPNRLDIKNLVIESTLDPGLYYLRRTAQGNAKQNGNNPQDSLALAKIWIFPAVQSGDLPYDDSFDSEFTLWQVDRDSSIWELGATEGYSAEQGSTNQKAWVTKLTEPYSANSHNWLYSPCFDLTALNRPFLSMDYWSDSEIGLDGTVLQASLDDGQTWQTVGSDITGINWYDTNLLLSNPGNQPTDQQFGWTGEKREWIRASHRLADSLKSPITRFRLAFRSSDFINPTKELKGFAFDNFFLGDRSRKVLVEHFPKASEGKFQSELKSRFPDFGKDIIPISYHIAESDPLSKDNPIEAGARALAYSISSTGVTVLGGNDFQGNTASLSLRAIDTSSLEISPVRIYIDSFSTSSYVGSVTVSSLDNWDKELILYVALLEDGVIRGQDTIDYVLRKFLPNTQGVRITALEKDTPQSFDFEWKLTDIPRPSIAQNPESLYIVAFLQDPETGAVLQAERSGGEAAFDTPIVTSVISSLGNKFFMYPNPTKGQVWLSVEGRLFHRLSLQLFNLQGQIVWEDHTYVSQEIEKVDLPGLPDGVYLMEVRELNGELIKREKILIKN